MPERALHGVNLAGWLTLEPWVTPSLFADSGALDERSLVVSVGHKRYHELIGAHRASFLSAADFRAIAARGFNAVRLPVPWYVFGNDGPAPGPFMGCISYVDQALNWADEIDLKVILVLAIVPGEPVLVGPLVRNHDDFAHYRADMLVVLGALAKRYASRASFVGIEVADEVLPQVRKGLSVSEGVPLHLVRNYYREAYDVVRANAPEAVVILPDAGLHGGWGRFMAQRRYTKVWLDSHLYHHADRVNGPGASGIRTLVDRSRHSLEVAKKSGLPVMVGKWSGALPYADSATTPEGRIALERVFISEQIATFATCPAWFFQTWKTEGRLAGWDAGVSLASFERRMLA